MKVIIKAASQDEFDGKRVELIKSIAGSKYDVEIRPKGESKPSDEKEPYYVAQAHILEEWDLEFKTMMSEIKKEIAEVING